MGLEITPLYAALLGLWLVVLSARVINARLDSQVSLGHGESDPLFVAQRGHGNFTEYVPTALLVVAFAEGLGQPAWLIHGLGGTLLVARLMHPFGLAPEFGLRFPRFTGTTLTLIVIAVASIACLWGLYA